MAGTSYSRLAAEAASIPKLNQIQLEPLNPNFYQDIFQASSEKTIQIAVVPSAYDIEQQKQAEQLAAAKALRLKEAANTRITITPAPADSPSTVLSSKPGIRRSVDNFAAGQCTSYVASKFPVTWRGNAKQWATNARAQGYLVDKNPVAGAILQTTENSYRSQAGHVTYIDRVEGGVIYISEQNFLGWGIVDTRAIPVDSPLVGAIIHRL